MTGDVSFKLLAYNADTTVEVGGGGDDDDDDDDNDDGGGDCDMTGDLLSSPPHHCHLYFLFHRIPPLHWSGGMRCCRSDWPGLVLSTLVCCQPKELTWIVFLFVQFYSP